MLKTTHEIYFKDSREMNELKEESIDLMITSPPYPMIGMWDNLFSSLNTEVKQALEGNNERKAFNLMHEELNSVWEEIARVMKPGGIACVNIGDATRKIGETFQLFPNHVKIINNFQKLDFSILPHILWRKQTNAPNKFMGSGMLPPNAYVTLEHEYILIFRKGGETRSFKPKAERRYKSAYFWEERNTWFSDLWTEIKGTSQNLEHNGLRSRATAFPLGLPYRLINMYSVYGDTVLDPFWGTGTTSLAAMALARNSVGYELKREFFEVFEENMEDIKKIINEMNEKRIRKHLQVMKKRNREGESPKYQAKNYGFPVTTKQERHILFRTIKEIKRGRKEFILEHKKFEPVLEGSCPSQERFSHTG